MDKTITLKPKREEPVLRRHPWLFSGAVASVNGDPEPGDTVEIFSSAGEWLARGSYSPHSQIRVRIWTWDPEEEVNDELIASRVQRAIDHRKDYADDPGIEAFREIHAESDMLPGVITDRYGHFRIIQILSAGAERWRKALTDALAADGGCLGLYERSDVDVRALEGLEERVGLIWGIEPPEFVEIHEHDLIYHVNLKEGHKTGFYLDQRENRLKVREWIRGGAVLDAFCYTGGFALNAERAGATDILAIDSSETTLEQAALNSTLNSVPPGKIEWRNADVFSELRLLRDVGRKFDVVILDPPRFAPTTSQVHRAARGYKDINLLGFRLLKPKGRLITFSCSGGVSPDLFQKIVADAALDAGVDAQIRAWLSQSRDHPVATSFPEGRYLKGLICTI
jgi:23S rRNA (cytosine1962-C5)-methyltransferase